MLSQEGSNVAVIQKLLIGPLQQQGMGWLPPVGHLRRTNKLPAPPHTPLTGWGHAIHDTHTHTHTHVPPPHTLMNMCHTHTHSCTRAGRLAAKKTMEGGLAPL